jgi:WD repeat-containing protein 19
VNEKYRKKIELMVRKPDREGGEDPDDLLSECCFCGLPGPQTDLQCRSCQSAIPFDVATGAQQSRGEGQEAVQRALPLVCWGSVACVTGSDGSSLFKTTNRSTLV